MLKVKVSMGTTYCGCPTEKIEYEYYGTEKEFNADHQASTDILNMVFNNEFPHYFLDIETEEVPDDDEDECDDEEDE